MSAAVPVAAERFNNPIAVVGDASVIGSGTGGETFSFASVDRPNVTLETVKKAEKSDALVLRVFEHANARANATITFGIPVKSASRVNLMEEGGEPLEVTEGLNAGKAVPLRFSVPMAKLEPGRYECQVSVMDPTAGKFNFWRATVVVLPAAATN